MPEFTDRHGASRPLTLTIGKAKAIRAALAVDLLAVGDPKNPTLAQLADDPSLATAVIWALANPDYPTITLDEKTFWDSIDDAAFDRAVSALMETILRFFRPGRRAVIRAALDLTAETENALAQRLAEMKDAPAAAAAGLAAQVTDQLRTLGKPSTV